MESYDTASWWARTRHDDRVKAERRQACIRGESAFDPATVKFTAEPEPEPAREGRRPVVYFAKGTCYAQALAIGPTPLEAAINRVFGVAGR